MGILLSKKIELQDKIIEKLTTENKELKKENEELKGKMDSIEATITELNELTQKTKDLQAIYIAKIQELKLLKKEYNSEMKSILSTIRKNK